MGGGGGVTLLGGGGGGGGGDVSEEHRSRGHTSCVACVSGQVWSEREFQHLNLLTLTY
jgi:hypothetical protein